MNRRGYKVNWTDTRKNITYETPDGKKFRDNKLHDPKYLNEGMENEFRRIKEQSAVYPEPAEEYGRNGKAVNHSGGNRATDKRNELHERPSTANGENVQEHDYGQRRSIQAGGKSFAEGKTASKDAGNSEKDITFSDNNGSDARRHNNKINSLIDNLERNKALAKVQPTMGRTIRQSREDR